MTSPSLRTPGCDQKALPVMSGRSLRPYISGFGTCVESNRQEPSLLHSLCFYLHALISSFVGSILDQWKLSSIVQDSTINGAYSSLLWI